MLTKQALHTLLDLDLPADFPEVLVYAEEKTPRLEYACRFVFNHVLKLQCKFTSDRAVFEGSDGIRVNYSGRALAHVFQVHPHGLLSEKGISKERPIPFFKNGMIYFYEKQAGDFSYDIFSAVFYFISRYEEWQEFTPDVHQRFEAAASLLYKNNFHLKPVVDLWIFELAERLEKFYPGIKLPEKKFRVISTIDVDNLYAYRSKGLVRTLGAGAKDLLKGDIKNLKERISVLSGKKEDPFDIYAPVSDFCFEKKIPLVYFFLFRTGTAHDRTVDPASGAYMPVFKTLKENHALLGLHPSYNSSVRKELLREEIKNLAAQTREKITISRQHYLRFNIRTTPGLLLENGIEVDFSMGFASAPGFRAGTSHPFYYYDFNKEEQASLLFMPFCVMDGVYTVYHHIDPEQAYVEMLALAKEIKKVNGIFTSVFHERTFSDHLYKGFGTLYKKIHSSLKEL